jgi:hypothetical protein
MDIPMKFQCCNCPQHRAGLKFTCPSCHKDYCWLCWTAHLEAKVCEYGRAQKIIMEIPLVAAASLRSTSPNPLHKTDQGDK